MYYKAKVNFKRMSVHLLDQVAENVLIKMTGNELFPNPTPGLSVLETDLYDYRVAAAEAVRGGKHATTVRNQVRGRLENTLRSIALSVQLVAMGNAGVILASGFDHNKAPEPKGHCPHPIDFVAVSGPLGSCSVKLRVKPHRTARSYRFAYRLVGSMGAWTEVSSHGSRLTLTDLQRFVEYEFRCTYVGNITEESNYSDMVTATVI